MKRNALAVHGLDPAPAAGRFPLLTLVVLVTAVFACSIYANLSFAVSRPSDFRYLPPFEPRVDGNMNRHLGGEYLQMARSLTAGEGFAHPFDEPTGPTAWQPPVLPAFLAALLCACGGDRDAVMVAVIFMQVFVLIGTGLLVVALLQRTCPRPWVVAAVIVYILWLLCNFQLCFQFTHDCWLVLLALDLLIAGLCWLKPLHRRRLAVAWGLFGGLCALVNPIVGFTWGLWSLLVGIRQRQWPGLTVAALAALLTLTPWTVRNYLVLGRFIPTKSNLAYELYQSECLQGDGLLHGTTFAAHPYHANTRERQEYKRLGEIAYLEHKRQQFCQAVCADPVDFLERVGHRFLGATLWYTPFWGSEARRTWVLWVSRVTHPLPFVALLALLATAYWRPLQGPQWTVVGVYAFYLLPYVGVSYYERYGLPLLGVKVLLLIWAVRQLFSFWPRGQGTSTRQTSILPPVGTDRRAAAVPQPC